MAWLGMFKFVHGRFREDNMVGNNTSNLGLECFLGLARKVDGMAWNVQIRSWKVQGGQHGW